MTDTNAPKVGLHNPASGAATERIFIAGVSKTKPPNPDLKAAPGKKSPDAQFPARPGLKHQSGRPAGT